MKSKISFFILIFAVISIFSTVNAQGLNNKFSVGFQGLVIGDLLSGVSSRYWMGDKIGLEGNAFHARVDLEDEDTNLYALTSKLMFAPVVKDNSKFYLGAEFGYAQLYDDDDIEANGLLGGPFFGTEFSFQELPELGFNFEVGYKFSNVDIDKYDYSLRGVSTTFGIHFYF